MSEKDKNSIDDKKKENESKDTVNGVMHVFKSLISFGIILIIGTLTLYSVRASQTGLIPTNTDCNPYTNINGKLEGINVNMNVLKSGENVYSTKVNFPMNENLLQMEKGLFGFLKNIIYGEKASTFGLYIGKTLENVLSANFSFLNTIYNVLNSHFPESFIILFGPLIMFFTQFTSFFINMFVVVYRWFYNIYLLFSTKKQENGKTKWEEHSIFDVLNVGWSAIYYFAFFMLFCFCGLVVVPSVAIFISFYCILFPLFLQSNIVKTGESGKDGVKMKPFGLKQAILDTFTFKKSMIMYIFTLIVIGSVSTDFSSYVLVGTILGFLILYFFTDIYKQHSPKAIDFSTLGFASFDPVKIETVSVIQQHTSAIQNILKSVL